MPSTPQIEIQRQGDVTVARLQDRRIIDGEQIQALGDALIGLLASESPQQLVVNLGQIQFLSSAALGKFIAIDKAARQHKTRMILTNIRPEIYQVFVTTRLNELFDIRDDESDVKATA